MNQTSGFPSLPANTGMVGGDIGDQAIERAVRSARVKALSVFAMMIGTLQLSCALADRQLADEVLEQGIQSALVLLAA